MQNQNLKSITRFEFPLTKQQFIQPMPDASDFAGRIVEFGKGFDRVAFITNETKDSGDVFKALHQYVVLDGFQSHIKNLFKEQEGFDAVLNPLDKQYKEIAFTQSGLKEILKSVQLNTNSEAQTGDYYQDVNTVKALLSIYKAAMSADLNHPTADHEQQLQTAVTLANSSTPIPGAPWTWCQFFMSAVLILVIGLLIALGGSSNQ